MYKIFKSKTCPKCSILQKKLEEKNIEFEEVYELKELIDLGFKNIPVLKIKEDYLDFAKAISHVNKL